MGKLVHVTNGSIDLLIEDEHGSPDELFVHPTEPHPPARPHRYGWQL